MPRGRVHRNKPVVKTTLEERLKFARTLAQAGVGGERTGRYAEELVVALTGVAIGQEARREDGGVVVENEPQNHGEVVEARGGGARIEGDGEVVETKDVGSKEDGADGNEADHKSTQEGDQLEGWDHVEDGDWQDVLVEELHDEEWTQAVMEEEEPLRSNATAAVAGPEDVSAVGQVFVGSATQ